ncbi:MAG TPA: sigma-70 family RNA polymerase sigma factor [Salinimicrobium sp.]|nr:sigma-70 family RNA polymerase sigma factor [Salinimicrobium sp.]
MEPIKIEEVKTPQLTETDIIQRILLGEKELYEILVRRNNQKLFRVIRSYIYDASDIDDLMQITYIKAYEKLFQFKQNSQFSTWLIRIGINECLARLKEKGRIFNLNEYQFESKILLQMHDGNPNPENRMIKQEAKLLLENAIDSLEPKYKMVYVLKELENMSIKEISCCLNISESNVKVRFHRAKSALREKLYTLSLNQEVFEFGFGNCDLLTRKVMDRISTQ